MKVKDKTVVITGGGAGIGRYLALKMLNKGAKVAICDINMAYMEETLQLSNNHPHLSMYQLDITDRQRVNTSIATLSEFRLDIWSKIKTFVWH